MKSRQIYAYDPLTGDFVKSFSSVADAERAAGVSSGQLTKDISRQKKTPTSGFFWSYEKQDKIDMSDRRAGRTTPAPSTIKRGLSVKEFRLKHDVLEIIRMGVKKLRKDEIISQAEFIAELKLPGGKSYKEVLGLEEFEAYRGFLNANDIRWGHPDDIAELKADRLLK